MEQGRGEDGMKQQQDQGLRRSKMAENQMSHHPQPPPPPQKCPRCDSLNTKFCYYNNYSLSQPRYFCKTCRRYWTQGGTLRNVPVGGGCRKGKRPKTSSSSSGETSRSLPNLQPPPPLPAHQHQLQLPPHMTSMAAVVSSISGSPAASQSLRNLPWGHAPTGAIYPSGGLFSSLAAMQSLSRPQGINQPINLGSTGASPGASMPIFQGFNYPPSMKSQQVQPLQMHQSAGFQGMLNQEKDGEPFYPPEQNLGQPATNLHSWNQGDNNTSPSSSNPNFWNNSSGSSSSGIPGSSANANQWPNLPGFGASP